MLYRWFLCLVLLGAGVGQAFAQATVSSAIDLKSQQLITFKSGKLFVRDTYLVRKVAVGSSGANLELNVVQDKIVESNQSCGQLSRRYVQIGGTGSSVEIDASLFNEFVAAANYYSKFRDNWESIRSGKKKIFEYQFGDDSALSIVGNRDDLEMRLRSKSGLVMGTKDLRTMATFSENVNAVQKFISTHTFDECL